jgi:hypothetical protein
MKKGDSGMGLFAWCWPFWTFSDISGVPVFSWQLILNLSWAALVGTLMSVLMLLYNPLLSTSSTSLLRVERRLVVVVRFVFLAGSKPVLICC